MKSILNLLPPAWAGQFNAWFPAEKADKPLSDEEKTAEPEKMHRVAREIPPVQPVAIALHDARDYYVPVPADKPKPVSNFPTFYIRRNPSDRTPSAQQKLRHEKQIEIDLEFNRSFLARAFGSDLAQYTDYGIDEEGDLYFNFVKIEDAKRQARWYNNLAGVGEYEYKHALRDCHTVLMSTCALDEFLDIETPLGYKMD